MADPITPEKVRELLEAATPGSWAIWHDLDHQGFLTVGEASGVIPDGEVFIEGEHNPTAHVYIEPDAALIAAAPDIAAAYLDKCAEVERLRAQVSTVEELEALPIGTVLVSGSGEPVWIALLPIGNPEMRGYRSATGMTRYAEVILGAAGPLTVVWRP